MEKVFHVFIHRSTVYVLSPMVDVKHNSVSQVNVSVLVDVGRGNWVCKGLEV